MNKKQLQQELSLQLLRASLRGKFEVSEAVERYNLTFMQASVLCLLDPTNPLPMNALSSFLKCTPSYITSIIEPLVTSSFITREELSNDRRVKLLSLTPQGVALRAKLLNVSLNARFPNIDTLAISDLQATTQNLREAGETSPWP